MKALVKKSLIVAAAAAMAMAMTMSASAEDITLEVEIASGVCFDGLKQTSVGHISQVLARAGKLSAALLGVYDVMTGEGYEVGKG